LLTNACKKPGTFTDADDDIISSTRAFASLAIPTPIPLRVLSLTGSGAATFANGTGVAASFNSPTGIVADNSGNLYIADAANNRIRKVTPGGEASTLAGNGAATLTNGNGTAAAFNHPTALAMDKQGNLFVADSMNNVIRKITPAGDVTTFAGTGEPGYTEGPVSVAQFRGPSGVAVDTAGIVYVADAANHRIRKITTDGQVTLLAGDGNAGYSDLPGRFAEFDTPNGMVTDRGIIYVADKGNNVIRQVTVAGVVGTFAGSAGELNQPTGIALDAAGTMYVADRGSHKIKTITPGGVVSTYAGNGSANFINGPVANAAFKFPSDVVITVAGEVYVADQGNQRIREIGSAAIVSTIAGNGIQGNTNGPATSAQLNSPMGLYVTGPDAMFFADGSHRIRSLSGGTVNNIVGTGVAGFSNAINAAQFNAPTDVALDGSGNLLVADCFNHRIRKVNHPGVLPAWQATTLAGSGTTGIFGGGFADGAGNVALFHAPTNLVYDAARSIIYVSDWDNHRIRKVTLAGVVSTFAGDGFPGNTNGTGTGARFTQPRGIALDALGNVYIADAGNNLIRKITPSGAVTTFAGSGSPSYADGQGASAAFNSPLGVAVDNAGNVYVADWGNSKIRKITPGGMVTTLAGKSGAFIFMDGPGTIATFSGPWSVAVDANGTVYVGDTGNNRIRKIQQ
jgi:sugar lactone lactonase YvrE